MFKIQIGIINLIIARNIDSDCWADCCDGFIQQATFADYFDLLRKADDPSFACWNDQFYYLKKKRINCFPFCFFFVNPIPRIA